MNDWFSKLGVVHIKCWSRAWWNQTLPDASYCRLKVKIMKLNTKKVSWTKTDIEIPPTGTFRVHDQSYEWKGPLAQKEVACFKGPCLSVHNLCFLSLALLRNPAPSRMMTCKSTMPFWLYAQMSTWIAPFKKERFQVERPRERQKLDEM